MKERRRNIRKTSSSDSDSDDNQARIDENKNASEKALSMCRKARTLWLQDATKHEDLDTVEDLYRQALNAKKEILLAKTASHGSKKRKRKESGAGFTRKTIAALSPEEYRKAGERLSLLYLQSSRPLKATMGLKYLGFECRLSERILNYPASCPSYHSGNVQHPKKGKQKKKRHKDKQHDLLSEPPCCVVDDFLSPIEYNHLRKVFGDVNSSYWTSHDYVIDKEPPAPYFSYVIDLKETQPDPKKKPFLRRLIHKILRSGDVAEKFPSLRRDARYVELWAHNRPHASGHQLHFDSDDEGRSRQDGGFPNHPICSCVLNVSSHSRVGGPTLVTNQRLRNPETKHLRDVRGWLVPSRPLRLVCFDGSVLHGVVPGKGVIPPPKEQGDEPRPRRVTLMMAFWKKIKVRNGSKPGSARPWPSFVLSSSPVLPTWANELNRTDVYLEGSSSEGHMPAWLPSDRNDKADHQNTKIIHVHQVYELLDGRNVPKYHEDEGGGGEGYYMPEYDKVFQGF